MAAPSNTTTIAKTRIAIPKPRGKKQPDPSPKHVADAAKAALDHALQNGATVVMIAYETPSHIGFTGVPNSQSVIAGLLAQVARKFGWRPANQYDE